MSEIQSTLIHRLRNISAATILGSKLGEVVADADQRGNSAELKSILRYDDDPKQYNLLYTLLYPQMDESNAIVRDLNDDYIMRSKELMRVRCLHS